MTLMRAIGATLAAIAMVIAVWSVELGKFVMKCRPGYVPADPNDLVDQYQAMAKNEAAAHKPADTVAGIQLVADLLYLQQPIPDDALIGISGRTLNWMSVLPADMMLAVAKSTPKSLQAHMKGTKAIRGLLAFDQASIEAYQQALERDVEAAKPEPAPRRKRRSQQPFPAFGAMC